MQIQTHVLFGWCLANTGSLTPRERFVCMIAAEIPDLDGLGLLFDVQLYLRYHHKLGHNLLFGVMSAVLLAVLSGKRRAMMTAWCGALFASHLLMDSFGSGVGWGMQLLWPWSDHVYLNPYAWRFQGWQNLLAMFIVGFWTVIIAKEKRTTPFEYLFPRFDRWLVRSKG